MTKDELKQLIKELILEVVTVEEGYKAPLEVSNGIVPGREYAFGFDAHKVNKLSKEKPPNGEYWSHKTDGIGWNESMALNNVLDGHEPDCNYNDPDNGLCSCGEDSMQSMRADFRRRDDLKYQTVIDSLPSNIDPELRKIILKKAAELTDQ